MKSIIKNMVVIFIMFMLSVSNVFADGLVSGVKFTVNGKVIFEDQHVYVDYNDVLVPIRSLYREGKYDIEQRADEVTVRRGFVWVKFFASSNKVIVNDEEKVLDTFPRVISNRLYIPLGVLENALNNEVHWDGNASILEVIEDPLRSSEEYNRLDLEQEMNAKRFAMYFCDTNFKFLERATISGDECYIFVQYGGENNLVAVERTCKRMYSLIRNDGMFKDAVIIYSN